MAGVVKAMDSAMRSMNLEKISGLMDKFEKQFEDLDVQSACMDNAMSQTTTTNVPQNDVDSLLLQVADEAGYVVAISRNTWFNHMLEGLSEYVDPNLQPWQFQIGWNVFSF